MHSIAERFLNGGNAVIDFFASFPGDALWNSDILGKCAIAVDAKDLHILADMRLPGTALITVTAGNMGFRRDKIAGDKFSNFTSHLYDFTGKLVAKDAGDCHATLRPCVPIVDMHISAADGSGLHLHQHIT